MGFPIWTLWGMGLAGFAALITIAMAYVAQSPALAKRFRYLGPRVVRHSRTLTGIGLASLLVMLGFFLAGAPVGTAEQSAETAVVVVTATPELISPISSTDDVMESDDSAEASEVVSAVAEESDTAMEESSAMSETEETTGETQSESGAFARPATRDDGAEATATFTPTPFPENTAVGTPTVTPTPSNTPTPSLTPTATNTPTPSPTPTATPSPTLTPTPITVPVAAISDGLSLVRVRQTPGGLILQIVPRGEPLLIEAFQASFDNQLWQQVRTVEGTLGWVLYDELVFDEE